MVATGPNLPNSYLDLNQSGQFQRTQKLSYFDKVTLISLSYFDKATLISLS